MAKRKPITKKMRFEIFKRDSFTCQYCGQKAPESILQIDHIKPIKTGGSNDDASFNKAFTYVPKIINFKHKVAHDPLLRDIYYIRGILRNRVYVNERYVLPLIRDAIDGGALIDDVRQTAINCKNWTEFKDYAEDYNKDQEGP